MQDLTRVEITGFISDQLQVGHCRNLVLICLDDLRFALMEDSTCHSFWQQAANFLKQLRFKLYRT